MPSAFCPLRGSAPNRANYAISFALNLITVWGSEIVVRAVQEEGEIVADDELGPSPHYLQTTWILSYDSTCSGKPRSGATEWAKVFFFRASIVFLVLFVCTE